MKTSKKLKRTLAATLALLIVAGYAPVMPFSDNLPDMSLTAYATDIYTSLKPISSDSEDQLTAKQVTFNGHKWYIIEDNSSSATAGTVTLLAADNSFGTSKFSDSNSNAYSSSKINTSLKAMTEKNGSFYSVKDAIAGTDLTDVNVTGAKLYLLSNTEAEQYKFLKFDGAQNDGWWLRSPDENSGNIAFYVVGKYGDISANYVDKEFGVRPALQLNLESVIFSSGSNTFSLKSASSTYDVTITAGSNMTKTAASGAASQTGLSGAMTNVVYTADEGYYFPTDYSVAAVNGISVTRNSYTQITVSGTPTADAPITLTAPTAKTTPAAPTTAAAVDCTTTANNDGKLTGVTTAMEYKLSTATDWTAGTGSDITGLVPGTYYVRVKATDTTLASDNQELTIAEYAAPTYDVTITAGSNMTKTAASGAASQTGLSGAITDVVYTADEGYYFPESYSVAEVNGITVTRNSYTQITVSGTPTADAPITLTAPTAKTTPAAPTTAAAVDCTTTANNDGKLTGVTTAMEYKKSGAASWTAGTGSDITGLVPGTYYVRVKATDTTNASGNQTLTIKGFISATVTFKVVNGKWNDETIANKTVTLTGHDGDTLKLTTGDIPAVGTKPDDNYKAGSWDTTPDTTTEIIGNRTFTYTYAELNWEAPSYVWSDDNSKVTATKVCTNDASQTIIETVNTTSAITKSATCETKGETTYTANFTNSAFITQTKTLANIPATGHLWGDWVITKEPTYTETGVRQRVCLNDPTHIETEVIPVKAAVYFTVSFDSAGGTAVSSQTIHDGKTAARPADPTRNGYTFRYWTLNGSEYNFGTPVTGNITLTAVWTENYTPAPTPYVPENPTYISPVVTAPTTTVTTTPAPAQVNHNITGKQTADAENELSWDSIPDAQNYMLYIKVNGRNVFVTDLGTATKADIVRGKDGKFYVSTGDDYAVYEYKNGKFVQTGTLPADEIYSVNRANNVTTSFTVKYTKADGTVSADNESYHVSVKVYYKPVPKATVKDGKVKLNWSKVPDAKKYRIYKYENGKLKLLKETDKASVNILTTEGEHTYAVKAYVNGEWTKVYKSDLITVTVE